MFQRPCSKPQVLATQFCPPKCNVRELNCDYIVPVVHPSHTTNLVNHRYNFHHSYPHTESTVNRIFNQSFNVGPGPGVGGLGMPGQVAGAQTGPWGAQPRPFW
ncbi:spore coat protein CotH [Bacillus sp. A301a_S52]|nr:spore coat protein CotH [Bacillus sp. A301a_S52]